MKKQLNWAVGGMAAIAVLLAFPVLHAILVIGNLAVHLVVLGLQLITSRLPSVRPPRRAPAREPFISIQVPAYNEPPEVLRETLNALARLEWNHYEVLVIDNNTKDESVWRPVEDLCRQLGPRFKFFHVDPLPGAKAGALNHACQFMDPRAEFVFVVDADYVIEPDALRRAAAYVTADDIALVQFPQEYRNIGPGNTGLALDFKHFFAGYMNMANHLGCVPSTGTLSLIRVSALREVDGFDTTVVTEDAEMGFRLNAAGHRSLYANEVIGRGLMPHDLESLKKQRWRWAFGNAQILRLNWRQLLFSRRLRWRQKLGYLIHLTAWFNFNLIPCLSLIMVGVLGCFGKMHMLHPYIAVTSWFTLATFTVLRFGTLYYSLRQAGHRGREIWLAYFTHLGLGWICMASWFKCVFTPRTPFVRTNKFLTHRAGGLLPIVLVEILLGTALLMACLMLIASKFTFSPVLALVIGVTQFFVLWVDRQVRHTFGITHRLQEVAVTESSRQKIEENVPPLSTPAAEDLF